MPKDFEQDPGEVPRKRAGGDYGLRGCFYVEETWEPGIAGLRCPYGQPGDRLWVRETFRLRADQDHLPPSQDWWKNGAWYQADDERLEPSGCGGGAGKKRPSIHMPRWASRITLEVVAVRVERLQDIGEEDATAEGVDTVDGIQDEVTLVEHARDMGECPETSRVWFANLWDTVAKPGAKWDDNPFVWCVEFKRLST
jgi:hypothetical protein